MNELSPQTHRHVGQLLFAPSTALLHECIEPAMTPEAMERRKRLNQRARLELGSVGITSYDYLGQAAAGQAIKSSIPLRWNNYHFGIRSITVDEILSDNDQTMAFNYKFFINIVQAYELGKVTSPMTMKSIEPNEFSSHPLSKMPAAMLSVAAKERDSDGMIYDEFTRIQRINEKLSSAAQRDFYIHQPVVAVHSIPIR